MRDYHFYSSTVLLAECIFHLFGIETKISSFYTSKSAVSCPSVLSCKFVIITLTAIVPNFLKSCMIHFLAEQVIGSENIDEADMGTEVSRFLEAYREGSVIQKRISGPTLVGFINSQFGVKLALIFILVVVMMALILFMTKEEPLTVGTRDQSDDASGSAPRPETREQHHDTLKED